MHTLSIDLETYSDAPIADTGAQRYILDPSFEILLFAYSIDGADPVVIDLAMGEKIPDDIIDALSDPAYIKRAYNASFEWNCLNKYVGSVLPIEQWRCTMIHGMYAGYTAGLEATGVALGLPLELQKLTTGKALIRYFCIPCKPTKSNGMRVRNYPHHDPDKWALFKEYNRQDVVTEMEIERRLQSTPVPEQVQHEWETDMRINSRGVAVDLDLVRGALDIVDTVEKVLKETATQLTGLKNPNSGVQILGWLASKGVYLDDIRKDTVAKVLERKDLPSDVRQVLEIRQKLGKTSTKKYTAITTAVCGDSRVRGLLQFYGATRSGRWAGRLVQVQNLPRTYIGHLDLARQMVKDRDADGLELTYGVTASDALSQLIRTAFIPTPGNVFIDCDFAAIEARVISWVAGQEWRLDVFRNGGDIYCASASQMFGVPVVKHGVNGHLRAKGKVAELALGYQGSSGALINMGALDMGLTEAELPDIVSKWRTANSKIQKLWWDMEEAATQVITNGGTRKVSCMTVSCWYDRARDTKLMAIRLPSGRSLYYVNPKIAQNRWGKPSISYQGVNQETRVWETIETYGGKLVENCVQAISRDLLATVIERLESAGLPIVFHVHDEVCIDTPRFASDEDMLARVVKLMSDPVPWAKGLPLAADGWVGNYFKKD